MSAVDCALIAFGALMIICAALNVIDFVRYERELAIDAVSRDLEQVVRLAGEARGVGAGKDGGG